MLTKQKRIGDSAIKPSPIAGMEPIKKNAFLAILSKESFDRVELALDNRTKIKGRMNTL